METQMLEVDVLRLKFVLVRHVDQIVKTTTVRISSNDSLELLPMQHD